MTALPAPDGNGQIAEEQAALRRVATLVARGAPPTAVLTAVTGEAGRLLRADHATMGRYGPDGTVTVVAVWSGTGPAFPVGTRWSIGGRNVSTLVFQTGRPARIVITDPEVDVVARCKPHGVQEVGRNRYLANRCSPVRPVRRGPHSYR